MDVQPLDRVSRALSTWLSRRKVLKGIGAAIAGGALARGHAVSSEQPSGDAVADASNRSINPRTTSGQYFQGDTPIDEPPIEEPPIEEPPTEEPPTEEPYTTEEPHTEEPSTEEPPTEEPLEATEELLPAQREPEAARDDTRVRIARICQEAADVLKDDVSDPSAFDGHPHPGDAFGFLDRLNGIALWGTQAETWDDTMLANYVACAEVVALAVRVGADAYYELYREEFPDRDFPDDPETCIFRELAKWTESNDACDEDDAVCRMTSFWNFTVLNSCRRCLRAF